MPEKRILQTVCTGPSKVVSGSNCACATGYVNATNSTGTSDDSLWCEATCDATSSSPQSTDNICVCDKTGYDAPGSVATLSGSKFICAATCNTTTTTLNSITN